MSRDKSVDVFIFRDQNGYSAEVYESRQEAWEKFREMVKREVAEYDDRFGIDRQTDEEVEKALQISDLEKAVERYERIRLDVLRGDTSERMWLVKSRFHGV